jgi:small conductance mechanosensitive channel
MTTLLALEWADVNEWFQEHGYVVISAIAIAFFGSILVARAVPRVVKPAMARQMDGRPRVEVERRADTVSDVLVKTAQFTFFLLALFTILPEFGIDIRAIVAGVGVAAIAVGFGAQTLIRDALNGIFILAEDQYAKGDIVTIAGVTGTVEEVTLRRTLLRDEAGVVFSVPNSSVVVAANHTREYARVHVTLPVAVASDLAKVRRIADDVGRDLADDPAYADLIVSPPAYLRVDGIDGGGVAVHVAGTVKPGSQWEVAGVLRPRLLEALQREGVKTPWG